MALLQLDLACAALRRGGVIAYPTEAVWGLGCDPASASAVAQLLRLKGRGVSKGLILVGADTGQFEPWLRHLSEPARERVLASWPGPVTWVVPNQDIAAPFITGRHRGVAIRASAHPLVVALCTHFGGPIVSTSANPEGRPPARQALQVRRYFPRGVDYLLPGSIGTAGRPSQIRDALTGNEIRAG